MFHRFHVAACDTIVSETLGIEQVNEENLV